MHLFGSSSPSWWLCRSCFTVINADMLTGSVRMMLLKVRKRMRSNAIDGTVNICNTDSASFSLLSPCNKDPK